MNDRRVHEFDNGVRVYDDHLIPEQRKRYAQRNIHEAEEEDIFVEAIRAIPSDGCYVNIGSAIGYYPILAKILSPDVGIHSIEPLEQHRYRQEENIALNGFAVEDFTIHADAISASGGLEGFSVAGFGSRLSDRGTKSLRILLRRLARDVYRRSRYGGRQKDADAVIEIKTITLDDLITRIGRPIDLLQMDVQGAELEILASGSSSLRTGKVKSVLIGTHGPQIHRRCHELLKGLNYEILIDIQNPTAQPDGIILARKGTIPPVSPDLMP